MYNRKKAQSIQEKRLRKDDSAAPADLTQPIAEKVLDHDDDLNTITESTLTDDRTAGTEEHIIEKVLGDAKKWTAEDGLSVPPVNTLVARLEADRMKDWKTDKESHWSQKDDKKQLGDLPRLQKNPPQSEAILLSNDRRRFETDTVKELVGGITIANVNQIVRAVKTGETLEHDAAILAILKEADSEQRELTAVEQKAVSDLKIARTKAAMIK